MSEIDLFGQSAPGPQERRAGMGSHQAASSITDEWLTPPHIIDELGPFDLDPCAPSARPWDTARHHLSIEDDGLHAKWEGRVWLNPPYSEVSHWLHRLAEHRHGTALIFARTETSAWFDHVWRRATAVLFVKGRLTFHHVDGRPSGYNAGAPSALVAYGDRDAHTLGNCSIPGRFVMLDNPPPTALERVAAMQAAGAVRLCRQTKPISEAEAQLITDFADELAKRSRA